MTFFFLKHSVWGKMPPRGAMGNYCSYSVLNIESFVFPSNIKDL